ncbi:hypothetical protein ACZ90_44260 [Streptomyces albus subsp. albus]|nr:hypothetical protein ACZ90_44260 [Streptomyces albus subsp. albus]
MSDAGSGPADGPGAELSEAIEAVRAALHQAQRAGEAAGGLRFTVDQVELEFTVELREARRGQGGLKAVVVSGDVSRERGHTETNRIKVVLNVADTGPGSDLIADRGRVMAPRPAPDAPMPDRPAPGGPVVPSPVGDRSAADRPAPQGSAAVPPMPDRPAPSGTAPQRPPHGG